MADLLSSLRLTTEETVVGHVPVDSLSAELCLIGKVISNKNFNIPAFRSTLLHSWWLQKGYNLQQLGDNFCVSILTGGR